MRARAAAARFRRAGLAACLALAVSGCGEVDLGRAGAEGPSPAIPPGAARYHAFLMQAWQFYFALGQDPAIGFSQVHQESRFDCSAVSPGGSLGCAQFLPSTAEWVNKRLPSNVRAGCPAASGCPMDPRWAFSAMVEYDWWLWNRTAWAAGDRERWAFTLTQYNGGGAVIGAERKACGDSRECNPKRYFDNVERFCGAAGRSAASCTENRQYPKLILDHWRPMYQRWLSG
jgi:soluble lytic murein transglycosylase-like protein